MVIRTGGESGDCGSAYNSTRTDDGFSPPRYTSTKNKFLMVDSCTVHWPKRSCRHDWQERDATHSGLQQGWYCLQPAVDMPPLPVCSNRWCTRAPSGCRRILASVGPCYVAFWSPMPWEFHVRHRYRTPVPLFLLQQHIQLFSLSGIPGEIVIVFLAITK